MNTKALLWSVLLGFVFVLVGAEARAAQEAGRIIARGVKGKVTAREKAADASVNPVTVTNNYELRQGMVVTTEVNASVVLIFANGAVVNLGTDSVLDIDTFTMEPGAPELKPDTITDEPNVSKTKINLTKGELVGKVAKLNKAGGSEFTVGTPVGAAGIRGTTFRIVYRPGNNGQAFFSLTTIEGNVEVELANGAAPIVAVGADQEVVLANVTVNVDNVTGAVTIVLPAGTNVATQQATAAVTQQVLAVVQTIVEATANITISTAGPTVVVDTPSNNPQQQNDPNPGPTQPQQKTTSGDGRN
jgi:hypothetical protein